ncbi:MAG: hypothetical protein V3V85_00505 [Candidatus Thorarchaeota archaeon]
MDVYEMTDQPETCRKCGTRTNILHEHTVDGVLVQIHQCPTCDYKYELEDDM